jgi:hypothetical protein|nr:hypothetical protein [Candidatus Krumholzibacteria bacterium]
MSSWKNGFFPMTVGLLVWATASLAAGPVYWDWPQGRSLTDSEREGFALTWQGQLVRGLDHRPLDIAGPEVLWDLTDDGQGGVLIGSGHGGELYRLDAKGNAFLLAQLEGEEIFSTLALPSGEILVGCGPGGQLFKVTPDGGSELLGSVEGGYVWDMARHPETGDVWLAAGSPAAVYRWKSGEDLTRVRELGAQNCLAVAFQVDGQLLLGTQGPGLVYRMDTDRPEEATILFQAAQDEIRQFMTGPQGQTCFLALNSAQEAGGQNGDSNVSSGQMPPGLLEMMDLGPASTVDRSALYRVHAAGTVDQQWAGDLDLMIAAYSATFGWLAGGPLDQDEGQAVLYGLLEQKQSIELTRWSGGDILDIQVLPQKKGDDRILVAQAHPGSLTEVGRFQDGYASVTSPALDGGLPTRWGRLSWSGTDRGGRLRWSVRTGNSAEPGEGWSSWTETWTDQDHALDLPPSRYIQWRAQHPRDKEPEFRIDGVSLSGWQPNLPPLLARLEIEQVSDISLGGMMNGSDNVTQSFQSGLKVEFGRNSRADRRVDQKRAAVTRPVRVFTWQGSDPNGDRLLYRLEYRRQDATSWRPILKGTQETIGAWDTSAVPDGSYTVRLRASDELDNPLGQSDESEIRMGPLQVDNTPPVMDDFVLERTGNGFMIRVHCVDAASPLAEARLILPDGSSERLDPLDLICDSRAETFQTKVVWPRADLPAGEGRWRVRVEIRDLSGNLAVAEGDLDPEQR